MRKYKERPLWEFCIDEHTGKIIKDEGFVGTSRDVWDYWMCNSNVDPRLEGPGSVAGSRKKAIVNVYKMLLNEYNKQLKEFKKFESVVIKVNELAAREIDKESGKYE